MSLYLGLLVWSLLSFLSDCRARELPLTSFSRLLRTGRGLRAGESQDPADFDFVASLRLPITDSQDGSLAGQHYCAAALVAKNVVITAAHCTPEGWYPEVHVNRKFRDGPDEGRFEAFKVVATIRHPKFTRRSDGLYDYDAALLILDRDSRFEPVPMQRSNVCRSSNFCSLGVVLGWGWKHKGDFESGSKEMLPVDINIMGQKPCDLKIQPPPGAVFCALEKTHACQVDSGGPLVSDGFLKGIASSSAGCGIDPIGMYTSVLKIVDWVDEQVEQAQSSDPAAAAEYDEAGSQSHMYSLKETDESSSSAPNLAASPEVEGWSGSSVPAPQAEPWFGSSVLSSRTGLDSINNGPRVGVKVPTQTCRYIYGGWHPEGCNG